MVTSNFHLPGSLAPLRALWRPVIVRRYLRTAQRPSLHIGCGGNVHAGWLNTDLYNSEADTYLDATKRFPFEDQTFERVFSEHLIEHLRIDKVRASLNETHRVLRPAGLCRISCPDLALYARKYIEKDGALERRFQPVIVDPPTVDETVQILRGLKSRFEEHHNIKYSAKALRTAAELADRYINERHLPDKAIDVIDEAGAAIRLSGAAKIRKHIHRADIDRG